MSNKKHVFASVVIFLAIQFIPSCASYHVEKKGYREAGIASWYGPGFHGRKTASGKRYNQNAMTAAHRRLPFGTKVKVTNVDNDKYVVVEITDRGPYSGRRVIDLSRAAAKKLEFVGRGVARVVIEEYAGGDEEAEVSQ